MDALVGGAVAFIIGVVLFPAEPLSMLREAERGVLQTLASTLQSVVAVLSRDSEPPDEWALAASHAIHDQLGTLARARATARTNVRVAPRRWRLRAAVDAENLRTAQLDLLANAVLGLVRAATGELGEPQPLSSELHQQLVALSTGVGRLASTKQPWPPELLAEVEASARDMIEHATSQRADWLPMVASIVRASATDLQRVIGIDA